MGDERSRYVFILCWCLDGAHFKDHKIQLICSLDSPSLLPYDGMEEGYREVMAKRLCCAEMKLRLPTLRDHSINYIGTNAGYTPNRVTVQYSRTLCTVRGDSTASKMAIGKSFPVLRSHRRRRRRLCLTLYRIGQRIAAM